MDLSVILANWNTKDLTCDAILSVLKFTKEIEYELIVIDNGSDDGSVAQLKNLAKKHKNIELLLNRENLGFGTANNQGLEIARGEFILLLNTDTLLKSNVLGEMVAWMNKNPRVGISSCALKNKDGSMQGTGGYFPSLFKVFAWMFFLEDVPFLDRIIKPFHPVHSQSPFYKGMEGFKVPRQQDWLTGAFLLIRAKAIKEAGKFDNDYFMYSEEVDLQYRIKAKGWQIWYLPKWSITHLGGGSSNSEYPILSEFNGIKTFYKKNYPGWQYPVLRFLLKSGALLRIILFGIMGRKERSKTYVKAFKTA